ncbi:hypothetical protein DyAD56_15915 [Dyella sp. AD56]|uniref:hypothetical protein n=1 Tax=Dyella sp. AD56 TaxID=1528744 RepID=UPI000C850A5C|nr:hypothetical protein [Dyella sp. AD56]PMQ04174.1 hypothetical protein DyAD56_15915 [Dyella sp. AD56]
MPIEISVKANVKAVTKSLSALAYKQIGFATATALTMLAKEVAITESANIAATFKKPKPFTVKSIGVHGARKDSLVAKVYVKPIAQKYLLPYETGGQHELPGRALLNPKNIRLDQYGQLTRSTLQRLKARSDVFIGPVKTAHGDVNGVWQRIPAKRGKKASLKLLIRFGDALPVPKRLNYRSHAQMIIDRRFNAVFGAAMAKAMATARE